MIVAFGHAYHDVVTEDPTVFAQSLLCLDLGLILEMHPGKGRKRWDLGQELQPNNDNGSKVMMKTAGETLDYEEERG